MKLLAKVKKKIADPTEGQLRALPSTPGGHLLIDYDTGTRELIIDAGDNQLSIRKMPVQLEYDPKLRFLVFRVGKNFDLHGGFSTKDGLKVVIDGEELGGPGRAEGSFLRRIRSRAS